MTGAASYHYELPPELVADRPAARRPASRLLVVDRDGGVRADAVFADLPHWLAPGDLLVVNDSRVLPARLLLHRPGGGRAEILLVRPAAGGEWEALGRPRRRLRPGTLLAADPGGAPVLRVTGEGKDGALRVAGVTEAPEALAHRLGRPPLPPYIVSRRRELGRPDLEPADRERYQTVYARAEGSVAAPTAGLHFDRELLDALAARGVALARVTLHVGPGTFRPPTPEQVRRGLLHGETFHCPAATLAAVARTRVAGGRVVAVGTTALRVLESVARGAPGLWPGGGGEAPPPGGEIATPWLQAVVTEEATGAGLRGETRLFLRPPQPVTAADALVTNFHLPGSSLLMLLAAFLGGEQRWRPAYAHAVARRYRFYSYGDAMLVLPAGAGPAGEAT